MAESFSLFGHCKMFINCTDVEIAVLEHFKSGDLVLADKGFLISDVVSTGVSVNIPPFLNNGKFNDSPIKLTKTTARWMDGWVK